MAVPYHDLICYSTAGLLIPAALWLGWWSLLRDRARGRRRCPKCWYDLRGTPGMQCSECGFIAKRERQFSRTRRRWGWAILSLLPLAAGMYAGMSPKASRNGWISFVPTPVLLMRAPGVQDESYSPVSNAFIAPASNAATELLRRRAFDSLSDWEFQYLLEKKFQISTRPRWAVGVPLVFQLRMPQWMWTTQVNPRPHIVGGGDAPEQQSDISLVFPGGGVFLDTKMGTPRHILAGIPLAVGRKTVIEWQQLGFGKVRYETQIIAPVEIVSSIEEVLTSVRGGDIDQQMKSALDVQLYFGSHRSDGYDDLIIHIQLNRSGSEQLKSMGFGFRVDLENNGQVRFSVPIECAWSGISPTSPPLPSQDYGPGLSVGAVTVRGLSGEELNRSGSNWLVRIRGDAEMVLRDWKQDQYWDGEFKVPLSKVLKKWSPSY